jgi:hypothetical protein
LAKACNFSVRGPAARVGQVAQISKERLPLQSFPGQPRPNLSKPNRLTTTSPFDSTRGSAQESNTILPVTGYCIRLNQPRTRVVRCAKFTDRRTTRSINGPAQNLLPFWSLRRSISIATRHTSSLNARVAENFWTSSMRLRQSSGTGSSVRLHTALESF